MAEIGLRSGKVRSGLYRCNGLWIERSQTGWWWVKKHYGTDHECLAIHKPFERHGDAFTWARRAPSQPQPHRTET